MGKTLNDGARGFATKKEYLGVAIEFSYIRILQTSRESVELCGIVHSFLMLAQPFFPFFRMRFET